MNKERDDWRMKTKTGGSELVLRTNDDDLLVFIDETGHEKFSSDDGIFGLGGVIVYGADYVSNVMEPWEKLRNRMGVRCLHASEDKSVYQPHVKALNHFFITGMFVRHAAMVTSDTVTNIDPFIVAAVGGLSHNVYRVFNRVSSNSHISRVIYIIERSERLHSAYQKLAGSRTLVGIDGHRQEIPHIWAELRKSVCEPGLEVSDFVMNAGYGHVREKRKKPKAVTRKDFDCVFRKVDRQLVEYLEITSFV